MKKIQMRFWNASTTNGTSLSLSSDRGWAIRVHRTDRQAEQRFARHNGRAVSISILEEFVPNWDSLDWQPDSDVSGHSGVFADDSGFRIALLRLNGCPLSDEKLVDDFREAMEITAE